MSARVAQKAQTRTRIVDAAARAIRERGLAKPSVNEVMAEAGLTVGGFYAHFDSKDALLLEALRTMFDRRMQDWLAQLPDGPPEVRRQQAARGYLSRKHRDVGAERCPMPVILGELDRADPRIRALIETYLGEWADALTTPGEMDGRAKALAALATMVGALTLSRALGPTPFSDELLAAAKAAVR
jgi:TetR/AcrR family transcriptional regulator, transcriptional repressor for nem operon